MTLQELRDEMRRTLLCVMLEVVVDVRIEASHGLLDPSVGAEVLARAHQQGLLGKARHAQTDDDAA
jgi:hypothetical protein